MWYSLFKYTLFRPLAKLYFRGRVEGEENIPVSGGVLLASNHVSATDTFLMPALIRRPVTFPAKAELFAGNRGPVSKIVAWFLKAVGQVPLDRSGGRRSLDGLQPILDVLANGGVVGIYPEGTRTPDGKLYKGRTGVARLALAAGVPVVPVAAINTELHRNRLGLPYTDHPVFRFGKPLDFSAYAHLADDHNGIRWITDEVMAAIQELSGQEYVDAYGISVKSGRLTAEEIARRTLPRPGYGTTPPSRNEDVS